jgi:hypothetical protein
LWPMDCRVHVWNHSNRADGCHYNFVALYLRKGLITAQQSYYTPTAINFKPHYSLQALVPHSPIPTLLSSQKMKI